MKHSLLKTSVVVVLTLAVVLGTALLSACGTETANAASPSTAPSAATSIEVSTERFGGSPAEAVAATAGPSVVNVRVTGTTTSPFFGNQPYEGVGSGVIYSSDGYIITNAHVVTQNGTLADTVEVTFSTGEEASATIVATDSFTDIAVIKVDKTGLPAATFATESRPSIGEYAIAIGSPFDYSNSVTLGIVSGLGRSIENAGSIALVDLIQTDAAISPGNSGGALVDEEGRVIGINVAYIPPNTAGAENIGFAIPAAIAVTVAEELVTNGRASHAYLGISYVSVTSALQKQYGLSRDTGVLIASLDPEGPAAKAGLREGDIITELDGKPVASETDMILVLRDLEAGDRVPVDLDRGGETVNLTITVGERSASTR
jgi:S1-C subfamily serine protease